MVEKCPSARERLNITAKRFPWQPGYNWHGMTSSSAPLNQPLPGEKAAPRFGAGWKYKLGFAYSGGFYGWTLMVDCLFGIVTISFESVEGWTRSQVRQKRMDELHRQTIEAVDASRLRTERRQNAEIPF